MVSRARALRDARGAAPPGTSGASSRVARSLSLSALEADVDHLSAYGKAAFALALSEILNLV